MTEFVYIDESGDTGRRENGGSVTYTLGCVLLSVDTWTDSLDAMIAMRREIKSMYGLKMSQEAKANHLVGVKKVYRDLGLGDGQVRDIYQRHLNTIANVATGVGAIVINKPDIRKQDADVFHIAWEYLFTRLRARTEKTGEPIIVVHDDGEPDRVRKHLRKFRRANWQGGGFGEARLLVEDSVSRDSQQSYFIQAADLCAYAASRCAIPATGKTTKICDDTMWSRLGNKHITEISTRGDGIYMWPRK